MKTLLAAMLVMGAAGCIKMNVPQGALDPNDAPTLEQAKASASGLSDQPKLISCAARNLPDPHVFTTVVVQKDPSSSYLMLSIGKVTIKGSTVSRDNEILKSIVETTETEGVRTFRAVTTDGSDGDVLATYDQKTHVLQANEPSMLPFTIDCDGGKFLN